MTNDNQEILTVKDHELFLDIAKDIRTNPSRYREAGKWLDEYCSEDAYWQRKANKFNELQSQNKRFPTLTIVQELKQLAQEIETRRTPALLIRFQEARDFLLKKYENQQFIPENDARRFILIVWLLTDPDAEKANINITELEKWSWEPIEDVTKMSRGYAQFLFFHGGRIYRPWMRLVRVAWTKLCAEETDKDESPLIQDKKGILVKNFVDNLLRALVKHLPFCGSFLYDVIYGTIDSQKSVKEASVQREFSGRHRIPKVANTTDVEKKYTEKWCQNRTIQAALIGATVLLLVSIVGWLITLRINKSISDQDQVKSTFSEHKTLLSLREICQDIESRPVLQMEQTSKGYIGMPVKRELLILVDITPKEETFLMLMAFSGDLHKRVSTAWSVSFIVQRNKYPELAGAKQGLQLYVSGRIENARAWHIDLSNVSLSFK